MIGIRNVMLPTGEFVNIIIDGEKIVQVGPDADVEGASWYDGHGLLVVPGLIDTHVHFRQPGWEHKEDWATGSLAAILGGVTMVYDHPNSLPPLITYEGIDQKVALVQSYNPKVDFRFWFGATANNLDQIKLAVRHPKIIGVKMFMGSSTGDLLVSKEAEIKPIFQLCADENVIVGVHAELEARIRYRRSLMKEPPKMEDHVYFRDDAVEEFAVAQALGLQKQTGCRLYLCHLSTALSVEMAKKAKDQGREIYVEVTPHHLWLSWEKLKGEDGAFFKMNPPLRTLAESEKLAQCVCQPGIVDTIGSDHAPHTRAEKQVGDYDKTPSGVPGVQTLFSLLFHFVATGRMNLTQFIALTAGNAAKIFGLNYKGQIAPGYDADLVLVDQCKLVTFRHQDMASKCGWTPYDGLTVQGAPRLVVAQGVVTEL